MFRRMSWSWVAAFLTGLTAYAQEPAAPAAKPAAAAEKPDIFAVPDGSPKELLDYITRLLQERPSEVDIAGSLVFRRRQHGAIIQAADLILTKNASEAEADSAVQCKARSLATLASFGDQNAGQVLLAMPDALDHAGRPKLAHEIRRFLLEGKLYQSEEATDEELQNLVAEIRRFIGEAPQRADLNLVLAAGQALENREAYEAAADHYRHFGKLIQASDDKTLVLFGRKLENSARRALLPKQEMPLEGKFLDGQPLNWKAYQGKVVLVAFWATWCAPCVTELPAIQEAYRLYHDRGFDVVAISCDNNRQDVEAFLKDHPLPWKSLFSDDPKQIGMNTPMAEYYGVVGVPTCILVGKDGKVATLNARGPKLREWLERLIGPADLLDIKPPKR